MAHHLDADPVVLRLDLDDLAAFFTMALIGVAACIRAEAPPKQVQAACRVATSALEASRPKTLP